MVWMDEMHYASGRAQHGLMEDVDEHGRDKDISVDIHGGL